MKNIYDLFNDRQEDNFDEEYRQIQESSDELLILEKVTTVTLEELVYNNPEKKKLSVLMEEVEASETKKKTDIIEKLKEQMKKVLDWITRMFVHYDKLFAQGADFVKRNNLNEHMMTIRSKRIDVNVTWHPQKATFQKMQTVCLNNISSDKIEMQVNGKFTHNLYSTKISNNLGEKANNALSEGDNTENYLSSLLKKFKFDKENLRETKITDVNVLVVHNNLTTLPEANKKLNNVKSRVQRAYNRAINQARENANTTNDKKANKADNKLATINASMKELNEEIRAYAKIMTMVFNEDYNLAKLIVSKATGNVELMNNEKKKKGLFGKKDNKKEN